MIQQKLKAFQILSQSRAGKTCSPPQHHSAVITMVIVLSPRWPRASTHEWASSPWLHRAHLRIKQLPRLTEGWKHKLCPFMRGAVQTAAISSGRGIRYAEIPTHPDVHTFTHIDHIYTHNHISKKRKKSLKSKEKQKRKVFLLFDSVHKKQTNKLLH